MPRRAKGPRLWLKPAYGTRAAVWVIRDGADVTSTGFGACEREKAEKILGEYLAQKHAPARQERERSLTPLADVLSLYATDCVPAHSRPVKSLERIERLLDFWGERSLENVTGSTCRAYVEHRHTINQGKGGGARRDLEELRAAINHHAKEGLHRGLVRVTLPEKRPAPERWLTRAEAARLIWTCYSMREKQEGIETDRRPLRHLARFILIGLYTGSRSGAILSASYRRGDGRSFIDLENGLFYRMAEGSIVTNKRQPPVRLPRRILAHLDRWHRQKLAATHPVEFNGHPVKSIKTAWRSAIEAARLPGRVTPHTLRHTAVTWALQRSISAWDAGEFFGMSPMMVERVYGHHNPNRLSRAVAAMDWRPANSYGTDTP